MATAASSTIKNSYFSSVNNHDNHPPKIDFSKNIQKGRKRGYKRKTLSSMMMNDIVFKPSNQLRQTESDNDTDNDTYWADIDELQCLDVVNKVSALVT